MQKYRVGVDIGGTFTDIVFLAADGTLETRKVSSTVDNYARAIADGVRQVFETTGLTAPQVEEVLHGTTVASNAILEMAGAKTGLITTRGFRDVLELRTLRMPRLYDLEWQKPESLVERYLRVEVDERIDATGRVETALTRESVEQAVDKLLLENVEAIAICLLNSFANPEHERMVEAVVREKAPQVLVCTSFDVLPEIKEYDRTSTTVINAYLLPVVANYLNTLVQELKAAGINSSLLLMQSNGGLTTAEQATRLPCHIVESGPAGGVVGAYALAQKLGLEDIVTFDMGGTTAKASLVENGEYSRAVEYNVGGGIMLGSRLLTGAGYRLKVPAIDLAEVGAGGGSIVWLDPGNAVQIGPKSAGASPGPVCYDQGGEEPTVTDANVILGYLNPHHLVGGEVPLNADKARRVFAEKVAEPLGLSLEHAAFGAHQIAASNMMRAIRAVSSERGRDPRRYSLFAFGGNGPLFAASMAKSLGMSRILVPPSPGLFSAFGLLYADVEHHYSRTLRRVLRTADPAELQEGWAALEEQGRQQLADEGFPEARMNLKRAANMHYAGQIYELSVDAPSRPVDATYLAELEESFGREHERTYGHRAGPEEPVELVNLQLVVQGIAETSRVPKRLAIEEIVTDGKARPVYFGPEHGWLDTPILGRGNLAESQRGPCVVEEYDATCVVPPGATATLDEHGNIAIEFVTE